MTPEEKKRIAEDWTRIIQSEGYRVYKKILDDIYLKDIGDLRRAREIEDVYRLQGSLAAVERISRMPNEFIKELEKSGEPTK